MCVSLVGKSSYVVSTQALAPGNQIFVLVAEDGYGESLMKIYPFTVSSGMPCIAHVGWLACDPTFIDTHSA